MPFVNSTRAVKLLLVEDRAEALEALAVQLAGLGETVRAATMKEALERLRGLEAPVVAVLKAELPDGNGAGAPGAPGVESARRILAERAGWPTAIVLLSGDESLAHSSEAYTAGVTDFLPASVPPAMLQARVGALVRLLAQGQSNGGRGMEERSALILESITDAFFALDRDWRFTYANPHAEKLLSRSREDLVGKGIWDEFAPAVDTDIYHAYQRAMHEGRTVGLEAYYAPHARWYDIHAYPSPAGISVYFRDISPRKRAEALLQGQKRVLEELVEGARLPELLTRLCEVMETQGDDLRASVLLVDTDGRRLRHGAAPSLPEEYLRAIDGLPIGPDVGSCGTAAFRKEPVVVSDVMEDPLWSAYRELAQRHGLRACWSIPILTEKDEVLGTFAVYHSEPQAPTAAAQSAAEVLARTAAVIIQWQRAGRQLEQVTAEAGRQQRLLDALVSGTPDFVYVWGPDHRFQFVNRSLLDQWGKTWEEAKGKNCLELGYEPWHAAMHDREIDQIIATKKPFRGEVPFTGTSGRRIYDYILVPVFGANGEVESVAGTTRDVTERKQLEEEQRVAREEAERERQAAVGLAEQLGAEREKLERANQELFARTDELRLQQERLQSLTRYLRSATRCAGQVAAMDSLEAIARTVVETLVSQFAASAAALWMRGARNGWLRMAASSGLPAESVYGLESDIELALSASKIGWVVRTGRPFISNDLTEELQLDQNWLRREKLTAAAFVPILGQEGLHGVLTLFSKSPLPVEVGEVLTTIAGSVATRLDYLEFVRKTRQAAS